MIEWNYFDKFDELNNKYLPDHGEGETMATQICTAVNKLIYKWYNDGDVFDNTYKLDGWANDLSSYANWLYKWVKGTQEILDRICTADENTYEQILKDLADTLLTKESLEYYAKLPAVGSVYVCDGKFEFNTDDEYYYE